MERRKHDNVMDWRHWERGEDQQHMLLWVGVEGSDPARYKLYINSAEPCLIFIAFDDRAYPLHTGVGLAEVEFAMAGRFAIRCESDADVWFNTIATEATHFEDDGEAPFTRYHEPSVRDPVVEKIAARMMANMNRLMADQADMYQSHIMELQRQNEHQQAPVEAPKGAKDGKPDSQQQAGDSAPKPKGKEPAAGQHADDDAGNTDK